MKKVLPNVTVSATSRITATSDGKLTYLCNVKRLSQLFYTGSRYILSHNITPIKWATIHNVLGDGFITKYADPLCVLGTGFGLYTAYIMFDIDRGSRNHPSNDPRAFERFLATLHKIGLTTPVIITSSSSGGIHVYYFFDRDINTFRIASLSQVTLIDAKFQIEDGHLELFPNCKPHDNKSNHKPHRSPLQPNNGGAILDRKGNPLVCGANLNHETQLAAFLEMAKASAHGNNIDKILRKLDPVYKIFKSKPSKYQYIHKKSESERAKEWRKNLEIAMSIAWTDFHETNELIEKFIEYGIVFLGLNNGKDLSEWAFEAITSAHGYKQYCRHQHQIEARIWDWIEPTLTKEFYVPYCGHPTRSSDRDNFIARYKNSKSVPTSKAEVYQRARVESVVSKLQETVETIFATIADIPSRIGDVIQLIQSIAREKFGEAFSRNTLYKPHYKYIWVKLLGTKKESDIVPTTLVKSTNIEYCPQTFTETAFEGSIFCVTDLPKTNLKPFSGETSHSTPSVCSVTASLPPTLANQADPNLTPAPDLKKNVPLDPDSYLDLELKHITLNSIHPQVVPTEPPGVDLIGIPTHDQEQLIEAALKEDLSPDPLDSDPETSLSSDSIESKSPTTSNSSDSDINPPFIQIQPSHDLIELAPEEEDLSSDPIELAPIDSDPSTDPIEPVLEEDLSSDPINSDSVEPSGADLINRPSHDRFISIDPDPDSSHPVLIEPDPDLINLQSALLNFDTSYQTDLIEPPGADLIARSAHNHPQSIEPDPIVPDLKERDPSLDPIKPNSIREQQLASLSLIRGCAVRTTNLYHVHGAKRGMVTSVESWGVYVNWWDGATGRYSPDELICTYRPNSKC